MSVEGSPSWTWPPSHRSSPLPYSHAGCAAPTAHSPRPYTELDEDTEYRIDERPDGFRLSISRSRHQWWPDATEMRNWCRTTVTSVAHHIAAQRGRRLRPIPEDRIWVRHGQEHVHGSELLCRERTVEYQ